MFLTADGDVLTHTLDHQSFSEIFYGYWYWHSGQVIKSQLWVAFFFSLNRFSAFKVSVVNPAGSRRETTQRIYVPINTNLGRGQRSKVTGLRCNDPSTAGHSLYRNVVLSAVWPLCYWPYPPLCCHHMEGVSKNTTLINLFPFPTSNWKFEGRQRVRSYKWRISIICVWKYIATLL